MSQMRLIRIENYVEMILKEIDALKAAEAAGELPDTDDDDGDLVELPVAAESLGVKPGTLRAWASTHDIGQKRGGRWLISISKARMRFGL